MKPDPLKAAQERCFSAFLGRYERQVEERLHLLDKQRFPERLWAKDASLWKSDPEIQKQIKNRLGWLTVTGAMMESAEELMDFAMSVKDSGFTHVMLLGMGGSSLCPEVCRKTFGVAAGYPDLKVLDSTDPATILKVEGSVNLKTTLFILASKSGTTIEVLSLYRYFSGRLQAKMEGPIGEQFIAITDPGTPLEKLAREEQFRRIFLNPPDIGGRYSALSYFGLVPATIIGIDLKGFLDRAEEMVSVSLSSIPVRDNPGIRLGAILGELGGQGRDKVTFLCSPAIGSFGCWLEQLLAESTGKEGKGLVPIEGEEIGKPDVYGNDRLFIYLKIDSSQDKKLDQQVRALQEAGHPVVKIHLRDTLDLAGEFFRWEAATATAGAILGINPFDEPNVTESKEETKEILREFQMTGQLPLRSPVLEDNSIRIYAYSKAGIKGSPGDFLHLFMDQSKSHDYIAIMAYLERSDLHDLLLQRFRIIIRDRYHIATTLGYGPRFLHSTGQLHKGGPNKGLFIQITVKERKELSIPGESYGFSLLKQAQALGDYISLTNRGCRIIEIRLGPDPEADLRSLVDIIAATDRR